MVNKCYQLKIMRIYRPNLMTAIFFYGHMVTYMYVLRLYKLGELLSDELNVVLTRLKKLVKGQIICQRTNNLSFDRCDNIWNDKFVRFRT